MTEKRAWLYDLLFVGVLIVAGLLRFGGVNWGEGYHQHPDELFLMGVLDNLRAHTCADASISIDACPNDQKRWMTLGEYFDSSTSTLNPYNRGNSFFVYGNLPMTFTRIALEATGYDDIGKSKFFARQVSALADLLTIFLLYLIASKLYGRKVGLFAAAFSAFAVMQIQQSHFFTTDLFVNLFMFLGLAFAVKITESANATEGAEAQPLFSKRLLINLLTLSLGFGFALGMAMASKINAAAMALVLPGAFLVRYLIHDYQKDKLEGRWRFNLNYWKIIFIFLVVGGLATLVSFRIFQPYAFDGVTLSENWIKNIAEQRTQANGEADLPWNLQWARRTHLYSFENLTVWGLGLPLGILAWAGFLFMGWRILKGEWKHALLWGWTAFYFLWQSMQFNPTMRYQLPIYPLLCLMAGWFIFEIAKMVSARRAWAVVIAMLGSLSLILTAIWAFAFQSIYLRPEPRMAASRWIYQNVPAPINLGLKTEAGLINDPIPFPQDFVIQNGTPYATTINPTQSGMLTSVTFAHAKDSGNAPATVVASIYSAAAPDVLLARASEQFDPTQTKDPRGPQVDFKFQTPITVEKGQPYLLKIETLGNGLTLTGASIANETDYDWSLPFRIDGQDPFGGLYRGDLNLQVYWDDNADKVNRFITTLDASDYIVIPTNHQYAQIVRLPERYPLTTLYYRELLGCPADADLIKCYRTAEVGEYQGRLGFELVKTFTDYPTFGPWVINDQSAEEAFTFYDHPKVMIFKKTAQYNSAQVLKTLNSVDLTKVVHLLPKEAANFEYKDLMLPPDRLATQRAGGTWSQLFSYDWLQNKYPLVGLLVWYVFIFLLGLAAYPIARYALAGFGAYAYPLGRVIGLVLLAWLSWMGGSVGVPYTRLSIGVAALIVAGAGFGLWLWRREQFKAEWNANRKFFVFVEILFLTFFLIDLLIRFGNSDLWHPSKGGERPMDFSYFNAVLKSTSFPPYDPWFAGGYINYYYYGFVIAGTPVKLLGLVPSIAYNFILPTWFALVATGAFAIGFNLLQGVKSEADEPAWWGLQPSALLAGAASSIMIVLLGNLGALKVIFDALQKIAAPGGALSSEDTFFEKWSWALQGFGKMISTSVQHLFNSDVTALTLPVGVGEWLWNPSRLMPGGPGNEIMEFPLFTFLYSDLHAHMLVIPLTLLIIAWAVAFIKSHALLQRAEWGLALFIGALFTGALKPTNTWDLYAFFPFAALAAIYAINRHYEWNGRWNLPNWLGRLGFSLGFVAALYALGKLMYLPFDIWYGQAYGSVSHWTASHTPMSTYLTHWGLFLFLITTWLAWETREWLAHTPLSSLKTLTPYRLFIEIGIALFISLLVFFAYEKIVITWLALPLAVWAGILLLKPEMPGVKRAVLLMIGTALALTIAVENIALVGDLGRMNTIFKIYMQAWILFAVSAGACFAWLLSAFTQWKPGWRAAYQVGLYFLLSGTFLFTLTAATDKITDRITPTAPHTLDSITYMQFTEHWDGNTMQLVQDYRAIRWLQDNVQGSPVIVEANCSEYRWCTRMTIYTGLPGVVGWNFHQRQQRAYLSQTVQDRVDQIGEFYNTTELQTALQFLKKYEVKYIIVGQLERNIYPALDGASDGLAKFAQYDGQYWKTVYHDQDTTIYEVLP
ncbi:MAG: glycosyltransferase family 39 protein [Anaerolineales bacterium]|nr:glycosyltransferase family 39 protein [Anaerolineales bacterium]